MIEKFLAYLTTADMMTLIHIFNVAVSCGLLILIWLVQIIIYPGLARIPSNDFVNYHAWYVTRITMVVLPLSQSASSYSCGVRHLPFRFQSIKASRLAKTHQRSDDWWQPIGSGPLLGV